SERLNRGVDARVIEWEEHLALGINPLGDRQAQPPWNERRRQIHVDIVLFEAVFVADLEPVAEALGGEKGRSRALALDQRVGGKRSPMNDQGDLAGLYAGRRSDRAQSGEHAVLRRLRRGEDLRREAPFPRFQRDIGERAANVDAHPDCRRRCHAGALKPMFTSTRSKSARCAGRRRSSHRARDWRDPPPKVTSACPAWRSPCREIRAARPCWRGTGARSWLVR